MKNLITKKRISRLSWWAGALVMAGIVWACSQVPFTGRKQMRLLPSSEMNSMAVQQYARFMDTVDLSQNRGDVEMVQRVGKKMQEAVEQYLGANGMSGRLEGFEWSFSLVEDPVVNAWAMPGGKVVFYSGIIPFCRDENGIAVVMGHEIAHIIAKHGNERMSQAMVAQLGGMALNAALNEQPEKTRNIFLSAYGIGAQLGGLLPFSRVHEKEADRIGLIIMGMAGYNPQRAVPFWERMQAGSTGTPPEFLSTHPSYGTRIDELQNNMEEALQYYKK